MLVRGGRIRAVIDFGIAAWSVFNRAGREAFRDAPGADEGTCDRARGFALHQAAMIIPYYAETKPDFVVLAKRTIEEVLSDHERGA